VEEFRQFIQNQGMTTGQLVVIALFLLAWLECLGSWLFGLFEFWSTRRVSGRFFGIGPVVWRGVRSLPPPYMPVGATLKASSLNMRLLAPDRCIFAPVSGMELGGRGMTALKGDAKWQGVTAEITVRAPVGTFAFMLSWLSLCVIWAVMAIMFSIPTATLLIPIIMFVGGTLILRHTWLRARRDSEDFVSEFTEYLATQGRAVSREEEF